MEKIIKLRETFFQIQICTTIPPEEIDTIDEELVKAGLSVSGTSIGWKVDKSVKPVKCSDCEGRWHYICNC